MAGFGKQVSILALVAVVATAMLGASYTLWYEDLEMNTTVASGELDGSLACFIVLDNDDGVIWGNPDYPQPDPLKDIGEISAEQNGPDQIELVVTNAYPGYAFDCEYRLRNEGTVAWHLEVQEIQVTLPDGTEQFGSCDGNLCTFGEAGPTDPDAPPLYVQLNDDEGCQLHAGEQEDGSIIIGFNQSAEESSTYTIMITFQINQWNESGWLGCGVDNPDRDGPVLPPPLP